MSKTKAPKAPKKHLLSLDPALDSKLRAAAKKTRLSNQAVMRMSLDRGIDILLEQLIAKSA